MKVTVINPIQPYNVISYQSNKMEHLMESGVMRITEIVYDDEGTYEYQHNYPDTYLFMIET